MLLLLVAGLLRRLHSAEGIDLAVGTSSSSAFRVGSLTSRWRTLPGAADASRAPGRADAAAFSRRSRSDCGR